MYGPQSLVTDEVSSPFSPGERLYTATLKDVTARQGRDGWGQEGRDAWVDGVISEWVGGCTGGMLEE